MIGKIFNLLRMRKFYRELRSAWVDFQYFLISKIGLYPDLYYIFYAKKYPYNRMRVTKKTTICIEGFPRSANTYAHMAFRLNNKEVIIGHHLHVAAQILKACGYNIPTIVIIREPIEAVSSFMVFQNSRRADFYLKTYINFYKKILPLKSQFIITDFKTVVSNLDKVIRAVNSKFRTNFNEIHDLKKHEKEIKEKIEEVNKRFFAGQTKTSMYPSPERDKYKQQLKRKIESSKYFKKANQIYGKILLNN